MDLRVQKTYAALSQAMQDLLNEKEFDQITVRELCQRARIRPATFYSHFADKYSFFAEMVGWIFQEEFVFEEDLTPLAYLTELSHRVFGLIQKHRDFINHLKNDSLLSTIIFSQSQKLEGMLLSQFQKAHQSGQVVASPKLLTQIFIGSLHQLVFTPFLTGSGQVEEGLEEEFVSFLKSLFTVPTGGNPL